MDVVPQTPYQRLTRLRNDPQLRLNSYLNWPVSAQVSPQDLCDDGFYYTGLEDRVQCTHCGGILSSWEPGDNVANEHSTHFPQCPWVISRRNNPLFRSAVVPQHCGLINISDSGFTFGHPDVPLQYQAPTHPADIPGTSRPKYPEYALESNRLTTFKGWPSQLSQKPAALAKGGLFYLGQGDRCKCFFCGGILYDWDMGDDIWTEHAKWFKDCPWVKLSKGEPFIRQVQLDLEQAQSQGVPMENDTDVQSGPNLFQSGAASSSTPNAPTGLPSMSTGSSGMPPLGSTDTQQTAPKTLDVSSSTSKPSASSSSPQAAGPSSSGSSAAQATSTSGSSEGSTDIKSIIEENQKLKDERTCKICMDEEVSVLFLPCGHMACCASCSVSVKDCPICRADIVQRVKAYWSL
ncbi:baculoviral IAP repeat-containing protein 7-B-like isoform X1 [Mizuhopecten yessoensis]|uniref:baculoviral IAP repeat-containing protein 7-B-like isoform X1 n=1 Tax=Mizuhopecten yessoensis TaxID=6573 RepID=UPI000B4573D4|nr:baculoviral IAP repeat-containing protein 7-B-like isoform X1 [Mizuhopecten yessoensis]XP_021361236.1 baculoviral IAP repeat-containing protein 7-B-like isoform X2 [Mizuhopecten yessoensis]XP_021361237.1 baculoviral IAP repeat-containing protein 7-B-like isoform X3 [Mizuhopecten yessoensis]XP_021361238.1 baculoviral IAP repeat-containing protein 7-B-like isoform X1 [Mizuhopecten yessoensis]